MFKLNRNINNTDLLNLHQNTYSTATQQMSSLQQIRIIDLFATKYIENIATSLAKIIRNCGIEIFVNIRNIENLDIQKCNDDLSRYLFICCPQTLLQSKNGPVYPTSMKKLPENKYFLYQFEQLDIVNINLNFISLVKHSRHTFDYSKINLDYYPKELLWKVSYLIPPVVEYINIFDTINNIQNKKIYDIFFCGYKNTRRENILNELIKGGYSVLHVTNVFGIELTNIIKQSKIFINLHNNDNSKSLETCRLNEAIMSKDTHIISESGDCDYIYGDRVNFIKNTSEIINIVKKILNSDFKQFNFDEVLIKNKIIQTFYEKLWI